MCRPEKQDKEASLCVIQLSLCLTYVTYAKPINIVLLYLEDLPLPEDQENLWIKRKLKRKEKHEVMRTFPKYKGFYMYAHVCICI